MKYKIQYSCVSHVGNCRRINQDNFICDGNYLNEENDKIKFPLTGYLPRGRSSIMGIFDGMGGEECGEVASLLAVKEAVSATPTEKVIETLLELCKKANESICNYASENEISAIGTTAALLLFTKKKIGLCNIGDSKIFRFADKKLEQLSMDHVTVATHGMKPPLSQNLGIPSSEMIIEPYVAIGQYNVDDVYLICSDGLTDMLTQEEIVNVLLTSTIDNAVNQLLEQALANGGKDNITVILCKIERENNGVFSRLFKSKLKKKEGYNNGN